MDNHADLKSQDVRRIARKESVEISNFAVHHDIIRDYLAAMLDDFRTMLPLYQETEYARDLETLLRRMHHEGISFAAKTLPAYFDGLLRSLETGVPSYPACFARKAGHPVFMRQLIKMVYGELGNDTVTPLMCLYQLCYAFKKLKGPYKKGAIQKQLLDFKTVDASLPDLSEGKTSVFCDLIIDGAKDLISKVTEGLNPFDRNQAHLFTPRPGPGATNTPTELHERFRPNMEYHLTNGEFKHSEWFNPLNMHPQSSRWDLRVWPKRNAVTKTRFAPTARLKFVNKTYNKARSICIEELEVQWLQQGLRQALYQRCETHPLTKGYVNFTDQSLNAALALRSSGDREYATIDMSAASDRIPRTLVSRLFSGNPELLKGLMILSTKRIEIKREFGIPEILMCKKYAPMGSALCFPVMGLVHWALIQSLALNAMPKLKVPVWVYGDDIIVPTYLYEMVTRYLPLFGMKINEDKSFANSHFRESCGMHAFKGVDITPTMFKNIVKFPPRNEDLVSALENEAALYKKGFMKTASFVRTQILHFRQFGAKYFPTVESESPLLGWIREKGDAHPGINLPVRWNSEPPMLLRKYKVLEPRLEKSPLLNDVDGYLRWHVIRNCDDARYVGGSSDGLQVRTRWMPDSDARPMNPVRKRILDLFGIER